MRFPAAFSCLFISQRPDAEFWCRVIESAEKRTSGSSLEVEAPDARNGASIYKWKP